MRDPDGYLIEVGQYTDTPRPFRKRSPLAPTQSRRGSRDPGKLEGTPKSLEPGGLFLHHGIARASLAQALNGPTFVDRYVFRTAT